MSLRALGLLKECAAFLRAADIPEPEKESELIMRELAGIDRAALYRDNPKLPPERIEKVLEAAGLRAKREPLQYILGYADFYGMRFRVGPGVLIPRPETEILVEEALKIVSAIVREGALPMALADLCTGSGCVAIALSKNLPDAAIYGTDLSEDALSYAEDNKRLHDAGNVTFLLGSLFEPLKGMNFDIIVSNPPYIKSGIIEGLEPEVRDWEPRSALDGGPDGLRFYREIFSHSRDYLRPGGRIVLEIADGFRDGVTEAAQETGFELTLVKKDFAGTERVLAFG